MFSGGIRGSSPCTLTTISSSGSPSFSTTSESLSVPELWSLEVRHTSAPQPSQAFTIRSSSVATTTLSAPACRACSTTLTIIGRPHISINGFPGNLDDAYLAGIITVNFTPFSNFSVFLVYSHRYLYFPAESRFTFDSSSP